MRKFIALALMLCALLCMWQTAWAAYSEDMDIFTVTAQGTCTTCGIETNVRDILRQGVSKYADTYTYSLTVLTNCTGCGANKRINTNNVKVVVNDCTVGTVVKTGPYGTTIKVDLTFTKEPSTHKAENVHTVEPTCMTEGRRYKEACADCTLEELLEILPVDPDAHQPDELWTTDSRQHFHACLNGCASKIDLAGHSFKDSVCTVCEHVCVHAFKNGACTFCRIPCDHAYELSNVIFAPGCDWEGVGEYTCTICSQSYEGVIPVTHGEAVWGGDNGDGTYHTVCKDCGDVLENLPHPYENGICTVCGGVIPSPAVQVIRNGKVIGYYATVQEAVVPAFSSNNSDNNVIKLLKNVDLGEGRVRIASKGSCTLDLNGKVLSGSGDGVIYSVNIEYLHDVPTYITIIDSGTGGAIYHTEGRYAIKSAENQYIWDSPVYITINSGTIGRVYNDRRRCRMIVNGGTVGGVCLADGYLTVNGGTIDGPQYGILAGINSDSVTVNGGTISGGEYDLQGSKAFPIYSATFPGGVTSKSFPLVNYLGDGMAYWKGDTMLEMSGKEYAITGGDVVVKAACQHENVEKLYAWDEGDGTHTYTRSCCHTTGKEAHTWDEDHWCVSGCGATEECILTLMDDGEEIEASTHYYTYYPFPILSDKNGLSFLGWDADDDGVADYAGVDLPYDVYVEGPATFTAVYGEKNLVRYYTIPYGGSEYALYDIEEMAHQGSHTLDYDYAYWYKPLGWALTPGGEKVYDYGEEIEITGSMTLYTVWEPFTVTFDLNAEDAVWLDENGEPVPTVLAQDREFYVAPTRPGYRFLHFLGRDQYGSEIIYEFYEDEETGERWMYVTVSGEMNLTAQWEVCSEHDWLSSGVCAHGCGAVCTHSFDAERCTLCGMWCEHEFDGDFCTICGFETHNHNWSVRDNGDGTHAIVCTCETLTLAHDYTEGTCVCGRSCPHDCANGAACSLCGQSVSREQLTLPDSLTTVKAEAFLSVDAEAILLPGCVTTIADRAFADCDSLCALIFTAKDASIANSALSGSARASVIAPAGGTVERWANENGVEFIPAQ